MRQTLAGNKYALALFQLAVETGEVERLEGELRTVKEVFQTNSELLAFLQTPRVSAVQKKQMLNNAFTGFSSFVLNTLQLLIDRHRIEHIAPMADKFIELSYDRKGIAEATVETVRPLTEEESAILSATFAKKVGKSALEIHNNVSSDLLGGLKIQIGNRIYDGSLRGKLDRLRGELVGYQS